MEDAPRAGRSTGPVHDFGPAPAGHGSAEPATPPPDEVPEVADALGARAHGLRRVAERIEAGIDGALARALRVHAGDVDALAAHLRHAGGDTARPGAPSP